MNNVLPLRWRRSTYCGPDQINCVELAVLANVNSRTWRKSSHSGARHGDCVEPAAVRDVLAIRDSKHPTGPLLLLDRHELSALLAVIKSGKHDL
ncbi:DUF397 domain-containing protein [Thermomonospora cellulosilytica]|uniref:DUF397 domain-containing protein n=1 Tax=Thermomonospora cellulosilytica TaxID=1411118 RepID=A0A7W3MSM0_9ACTN|nr:DUF397 domain-containing protein [Thermomonospora cellulosilytica]MBA9001165.1 hypothetical protein [Thermomonospora cellulosilytica]